MDLFSAHVWTESVKPSNNCSPAGGQVPGFENGSCQINGDNSKLRSCSDSSWQKRNCQSAVLSVCPLRISQGFDARFPTNKVLEIERPVVFRGMILGEIENYLASKLLCTLCLVTSPTLWDTKEIAFCITSFSYARDKVLLFLKYWAINSGTVTRYEAACKDISISQLSYHDENDDTHIS